MTGRVERSRRRGLLATSSQTAATSEAAMAAYSASRSADVLPLLLPALPALPVLLLLAMLARLPTLLMLAAAAPPLLLTAGCCNCWLRRSAMSLLPLWVEGSDAGIECCRRGSEAQADVAPPAPDGLSAAAPEDMPLRDALQETVGKSFAHVSATATRVGTRAICMVVRCCRGVAAIAPHDHDGPHHARS